MDLKKLTDVHKAFVMFSWYPMCTTKAFAGFQQSYITVHWPISSCSPILCNFILSGWLSDAEIMLFLYVHHLIQFKSEEVFFLSSLTLNQGCLTKDHTFKFILLFRYDCNFHWLQEHLKNVFKGSNKQCFQMGP